MSIIYGFERRFPIRVHDLHQSTDESDFYPTVNTQMSFATVSDRSVFINNNASIVEKIINNLQYTVKHDSRFRWSPAVIRQLIIKAAELIDKRQFLSEHPCLSAKHQSVAWHFINEFLECELDGDLCNALNRLLLSMATTFEYAGELAAQGIELSNLDVARDLNETMKLLNYPFKFHNDVYGRANSDALRSRAGKSSLRRPIAKAELVLAWIAHMLRLTRQPVKFTKNELTFLNVLGTMLNAFVQRYELIINVKYHQPCLDQLAFIRLMEIVYVVCIDRTDKGINLYGSWYDQPDRFKHLADFMDIRLSNDMNDLRSHLSRLPRSVTSHPTGKTVFYNSVDCHPDSPIGMATNAWLEAMKVMREDYSFEVIVKETAKATFLYEARFALARDEQPPTEDPVWYANAHIFELTGGDDEQLYAEQSAAIEETLSPIREQVKAIIKDTPNLMEHEPSVVFSVMLKTSEDARPELSFIQV